MNARYKVESSGIHFLLFTRSAFNLPRTILEDELRAWEGSLPDPGPLKAAPFATKKS